MHSDLVELGWTEEHWNRITTAVSEEAQKARVAAQVLPTVGPIDPTTEAVPEYALRRGVNPRSVPPRTAPLRLTVDSDPSLFLTKIAVNVYLRGREAADPELNAALTMFRRAANFVARIEDALVFNGRAPNSPPGAGIAGIPDVFRVTGEGNQVGLLTAPRTTVIVAAAGGAGPGERLVTAIIQCINALEAQGQFGPFSCVLAPDLFEDICRPNSSLILPRDRILPFLAGPLLRSSAVPAGFGLVLASSASPLELVVAHDLAVKFLQTTEQPRLAFQVSERIALRIKETQAIAVLA